MSLGTYQYSSKDVCEAWFWSSGDRPGLQKNILVLLCGKSVLKPQDQLTDTPERRQCGVRKEVNLDVNAEGLLHLKVRGRKD